MHSGACFSPAFRIVPLLFLSGLVGLGACTPSPRALRAEVFATGSTASLRALAPLSGQVCWAGGAAGTVLRTTDGGATWLQVGPVGSTLDFRSVVAWDERRAVVASAGQPARILRTQDGGTSWEMVHEEADAAAFFDALAREGDRLVLYGDPVGGALYVLGSPDGGTTWRREVVSVAPLPGEAGFAASNSLLVLGPGDTVRVATGGRSGSRLLRREAPGAWAVQDLPLARGAESRGAFALAADGSGGLVAVGGDHADPAAPGGTAAWSADDGRTWTGTSAGGYRSGLAFAARLGTWLAVGPLGCSTSADGGRTWSASPLPGFHAVAVAADGSVWASGSDGRIARIHAMQ